MLASLDTDTPTGLGDAHAVHEERIAPSPRARSGGVDGGVRAQAWRGRGTVARRGAPARLRLRDPSDARQAPAGRCADPARGGLSRGGRRDGALACGAPVDATRHAVEEGSLRLRRAVRVRARLRARAADRP